MVYIEKKNQDFQGRRKTVCGFYENTRKKQSKPVQFWQIG